jgi:hypothetical protein
MTNDIWGICCPGPSLALYQIQKLISLDNPFCLIAVNSAILLVDFNFDYWAVQDIEVFETVLKKVDPHNIPKLYSTRLWVPSRWLTDIPAHYDPLNYHFQAFYKETFPADSNEDFNKIAPFAHHIIWREYTTFTAIALAIINGAKDIRLYGADMAGKGYFIEGVENYRTRLDEKRWSNEHHWFECLVSECAARGIILTRVGTNNRGDSQ